MPDLLVKLSWSLLCLAHVVPAAAVLQPSLLVRLYDVDPVSGAALLLRHRAALFLAVALVCAYAALAPEGRRAAGLVVAVSVVGFLVLYVGAGAPAGALRTVALTDALLLPPLTVAVWSAWRA